MLIINLVILFPFLATALIPLLYKRIPKIHVGWFVLPIPIALFIILATLIPSVASGNHYVYSIDWIPSLDIHFTTYVDGLSLLFGLLITGIGSLVILYSVYYLSTTEALAHFYVYLLLFMGSMLGVVFSDNLMVLYVFWELTSISSFLLIAFWFHRKRSRYGAQKALLITVVGGLAMLSSFLMIYLVTGTMSIREILSTMDSHHPLFIPALILLLIGAFTKSAQFPFHIWLPDAMEAPTPVSAYLHSATMVKAGIYLVARFTPIFGEAGIWFWFVTSVGIMTLFWGSFTAVRQTDLKAMLAYSTVSQLGMILSLFGIGSLALHAGTSSEAVIYAQATFAALFHLINHSTFKGVLFMVVGIVDLEVGTRDIRRLGGLMSILPVTFTLALIGSFSMAGLPPFNGFLSKEMFFTALLKLSQLDIFSIGNWGIIFPVVAWIASIFTFIYSMIIVFKTFFGQRHAEQLEYDVREAPVGMLIPPIILASLVVLIFFVPNTFAQFFLRPSMKSIFPALEDTIALIPPIAAWHGFNMELLMTVGVVCFGSLLYIGMRRWIRIYLLFPSSWSFDTLYNHSLQQLESWSSALTRLYMTGSLRHYLRYIYLFFIVIVAGVMVFTGAFSFNPVNDAPIGSFELVIVLVMLSAAISILFTSSRVAAILLNGVLGYGIAILFIVFRAPDLALTQIVVETVTTALFLLCFYFLPKWKKDNMEPRFNGFNAIISVAVGMIFIGIALSVQSGKLFETISTYFERAYELAGGRNIVNAILGDFRAFDTMLEVVVLFIAGIGVYALIKLTGEEGENVEN